MRYDLGEDFSVETALLCAKFWTVIKGNGSSMPLGVDFQVVYLLFAPTLVYKWVDMGLLFSKRRFHCRGASFSVQFYAYIECLIIL